MVDYTGDYIGIRIIITRNTRCYNVILIIIHLFGDNTRIEPEDNRMFKSNYLNCNIRIKLKIYFRKYLTRIIIFPKK